MQNYRKTVLIMLAVFMSVAFYGCASARESEKSDESRNYKIIDTSSDSLLRFETGTIEDVGVRMKGAKSRCNFTMIF